uniref:AIG1-type G domain-containing protein n=1 Tax=Oreochromis niloticus TaxID=8128 RepID=A0A669EX31_ORENI
MLQFFTQLNDVVKMKDETNMRTDYNPESQHQMDMKGKCTITNVNLVLVGMAGTGKSASANSILGREAFLSTSSSSSVTTECQVEQREMNGIDVRVIDTPDIFDDEMPSSVRDKHVKWCKQLCESKPCVIVLVMHVSRFTDGERDVRKTLEKAFGSKVREKTVILFTRGDDLKHARMSLNDFLHRCQPALKEIIQKCGNRCVLFENMSHSCQVEKLMNLAIALSKQ